MKNSHLIKLLKSEAQTYLMQLSVKICTTLTSLESWRNVPEANVDELRLIHDELETFPVTDHIRKICDLFKQFFNVRLEPTGSLRHSK